MRELAHLYWFHTGAPQKAHALLESLADTGDVVAASSAMIIDDGLLDGSHVVRHARQVIDAAIVEANPRRIRDLDGLAELAARLLANYLGDARSDEEEFVEWYQTLAIDRLPFATRQLLISKRAAIARISGKGFREHYRRQGCVQQWQAGPVEGSLGDLELSRYGPDDFPSTRGVGAVVPLSCVVRLWNPNARSGVRRLRTYLDVKDELLVLNFSSENPIHAYLDGTLLWRNDATTHWPSRHVVLHVPVKRGVHELVVTAAVPHENAWLLVRASDGKGSVIETRPSAATSPVAALEPVRSLPPWPRATGVLANPSYAPLRYYLALEDAVADGDTDRAEAFAHVLEQWPTFAHGQRLVARFEDKDPSRGRTISATREREALERALKADPSLDAARLRLYEMQLERGEDKQVASDLRGLADDRLRTLRGELLRWRIHLSRGSEYAASNALDRAAKINPDACSVLNARHLMARHRDAVKDVDNAIDRLRSCPGTLGLRAHVALDRGQTTQAQDLWIEKLARVPDDTGTLRRLARLHTGLGRDAEAQKLLEKRLALNPMSATSHLDLIDHHAAHGREDAAKDLARHALDVLPQVPSLWRSAAHLDIADDLETFRVSGPAAVRRYLAEDARYEGAPEVFVLDNSVARIYANGGQRHVVHLVIQLLTKEAIDRYGEIQVPDGAEILTLQSIKADGSVREPELIAGKDGLSLRHLEVGDFVDLEYTYGQSPNTYAPGSVDVTTFRFQSFDVPYHVSELVVVHPKEMNVREDRRRDPPVPTVENQGNLVVKHWRKQRAPRLGLEPAQRSVLDELPSVHIYTHVDPLLWLESLALRLREGQRTNPELRRFVQRTKDKYPEPAALFRVLHGWVVENVEDVSDLSANATATFSARTGSRIMLLRAMLREAGIRSELWIARNQFGPRPLDGGHPMMEAYDTPLLAVYVDPKTPTLTMASSNVIPIGYLAPAFAGSRAFRVQIDQRDGAPESLRLPQTPQRLADERSYDLKVDIDTQGHGTVAGSIRLQGMEAIVWRQALRETDKDRVAEMFEQAELARLFRGAHVREFDIEHERDIDAPLTLRFSASVEHVGVRQGDALAIPQQLIPMNPGSKYATLAERRTGLVIPYGPRQRAHVELVVRDGKLASVPAAVNISTAMGSFERSVVVGEVGGSRLVVDTASSLAAGVVAPETYDELAQFVRKVERAERGVIEVR